MNVRKLMVMFCLAAFTLFAPVAAFANGGNHCNGDCGAEIKIFSYFDANQNGRYNSSVDGTMDGSLVSIYNANWAYMGTQAVGRGDGVLNNSSDRGLTTWPGLNPGIYIVCAHGYEVFFTQPTSSSPNPSSRVSVVLRPSVNDDQSRYCYRFEMRNACSEEGAFFGFYSNVE